MLPLLDRDAVSPVAHLDGGPKPLLPHQQTERFALPPGGSLRLPAVCQQIVDGFHQMRPVAEDLHILLYAHAQVSVGILAQKALLRCGAYVGNVVGHKLDGFALDALVQLLHPLEHHRVGCAQARVILPQLLHVSLGLVELRADAPEQHAVRQKLVFDRVNEHARSLACHIELALDRHVLLPLTDDLLRVVHQRIESDRGKDQHRDDDQHIVHHAQRRGEVPQPLRGAHVLVPVEQIDLRGILRAVEQVQRGDAGEHPAFPLKLPAVEADGDAPLLVPEQQHSEHDIGNNPHQRRGNHRAQHGPVPADHRLKDVGVVQHQRRSREHSGRQRQPAP